MEMTPTVTVKITTVMATLMKVSILKSPAVAPEFVPEVVKLPVLMANSKIVAKRELPMVTTVTVMAMITTVTAPLMSPTKCPFPLVALVCVAEVVKLAV